MEDGCSIFAATADDKTCCGNSLVVASWHLPGVRDSGGGGGLGDASAAQSGGGGAEGGPPANGRGMLTLGYLVSWIIQCHCKFS